MLNSEAIKIIQDSESCVLYPYKNKGDRWTIGWGNTFYEDGKPVRQSDKPLSQLRADNLFRTISNNFYREVKKLIKSEANNIQVSALTSLAYNIGIENFKTSTLLRLVNKNPHDFLAIEPHFLEWNKDNGKISKGLTIRRGKEFSLYKKKI
jgi:lysozyme